MKITRTDLGHVLSSVDGPVYTSRRDLARARYDTLFQGLKLKAAAGVLPEADLLTINGLLVEVPWP